MRAAAKRCTQSQWGRAFLAALLFFALLLSLSFGSFALPAYADEIQYAHETEGSQSENILLQQSQSDSSQPDSSQSDSNQTGEQEGVAEVSETPGYKVYRFSEQDLIEAQTNQTGTRISDAAVPLASFSQDGKSPSSATGGSLVNTLIVLLNIVSMVAMLLLLSIRKTTDYRVIAVRTIAAAFGLVTITTWSLLDRLQIPTVATNDSTALIVTLFCLYTAIAAGSFFYEAHLRRQKQSVL